MTQDKTNQTFSFDNLSNSSTPTKSKQIDFTPKLINTSDARALEVLRAVKDNPELKLLATEMIQDGDALVTINLIKSVISPETIELDSEFLNLVDDSILDRLLESRRSDRSKTKAKGFGNLALVLHFVSTMYAELLVRSASGKEYNGSTGTSTILVDENDPDTINRKIASLRSKRSRLSELAKYNNETKVLVQNLDDQIAALKMMLPDTHTQSKTVVKDLTIDQVRAALDKINTETLTPEQLERYNEYKKLIG